MLGGVASGLAVHLRWPVRVVRIAFACLVLAGGAGILLYLWFWAFTPRERDADAAAPVSRRLPVAALSLALAALFTLAELGAIFARSDAAVNFTLLAVIVFGGGTVAWSLAMDAADPARSARYGTLARSASTFILLLAGIATSGVVLSTVRHGADADYRLVVVADCCGDGDADDRRLDASANP